MAEDKAISELPLETAPSPDDLVPIATGLSGSPATPETKAATLAKILQLIGGLAQGDGVDDGFGAFVNLLIKSDDGDPYAIILRRVDLGGDDSFDVAIFNDGGALQINGPNAFMRFDGVGGAGELSPVLFGDLPASPSEGMYANITDGSTNVWGATVSGSGSNKVLVRFNGTNWTVVGK